ncbi:MAG: NAD-dependent dihydropyrimidine dehydrogenase subunit PreA [Chloroflexi bacterium]|nr:NAD-dependent dihydropyrimidine dehydrogenase subunit PreA [Chloroflexota bacterium]MCL5074876.1 NAD-dependent dihydropyrimidine dehydrogenase subunit PreA [Chloroflexota bacterium]
MLSVDLAQEFCGVRFSNPFTLAASPCTDKADRIARAFAAGWGGAVLKTTSMPSEEVSLVYPMISGLRRGQELLGLHNIDLISVRHIEEIVRDIRWLKAEYPDRVVIGSIMASRQKDWEDLARQLEEAGADLIECSLSCPHGTPGGLGYMISQDPRLTEMTARWVKEAVKRTPVYVKLTSNVTDIVEIARAVEASGCAGVCAIDSVEALIGLDLATFSPLPSVRGRSSFGGYTGRAIKPIALRCVADIARHVRLPLAGVGGIYDWRDAAEFLLVGASNLQVCTAAMENGFGLIEELADGLSRFLVDRGYAKVADLCGLALPKLCAHEELSRQYKVRSHIINELCIGCGRCYVACRDGGHEAIVFGEDRVAAVDEKSCVGCGLCLQVCPVPTAVTLQEVEAPQTSPC